MFLPGAPPHGGRSAGRAARIAPWCPSSWMLRWDMWYPGRAWNWGYIPKWLVYLWEIWWLYPKMVFFYGKYDDCMSDHWILGYPVFRQNPFVCLCSCFPMSIEYVWSNGRMGTTEMFQRTCCRWLCRAKRTFAQYSSTISNPYAVQPHLTWSRNHVINCSQKKCVFGSPHIQDNSSFYWIPKRNIYIPILIHFWDAPQIRLLITKTCKKCRFSLSKPYPCFTPMVWIKLGAPLGDGRFHRLLHGHFQLGGELLPLLLPDDGTIGGLTIWKLLKTTHWRTDYFLPSPPTDVLFWHCIWHSIWHTFWHILTYHLAVYLTYISSFYLAFYLTYILTFDLAFFMTFYLTYTLTLPAGIETLFSSDPCWLWRLLFEARGWNRASNQEPE